MAIKFLYIDDEPDKALGIVKNVAKEGILSFDVEAPMVWSEEKYHLIDSRVLDNYDGLLLDLKLEFSEVADNNTLKFNGADLAQSIRSDIKANKINDLPIFLCSTDEYFMSFFDKTSFDLFDKKLRKEVDFRNTDTINVFIAYGNAYRALRENRNIENILGKEVTDNDDQVALRNEVIKCSTLHEVVYLIDNHVLNSNGILLDEELLAIRLGVDYQKSGDWDTLKNGILGEFKYTGILNECYERWWQNEIYNWWKNTFNKSLKVISAENRVALIMEKYGLKDIYSLPLPKHHQFETYWYKCRLSTFPLEPTDALRTIEMPKYLWQEPSYISMAYIMSEERDRKKIVSLLSGNEYKIFESLTK